MKIESSRVLAVLLAGATGCTAITDGPRDPDSGFGFDGGPAFLDDGGCHPFGGAGGGISGGGTGGGGPILDSSPVVEPARPPPAISGGTLAVLPDDTIVVADPDRDLVYLVDPDNRVVTLTLAPGEEPGRVAAGPGSRVFVALRRTGRVLELDVVTRAIVARHDVCQLPRGLGWSAARQTLYVACATGELTELTFDERGRAVTDTRFVAEDLRDVVVTEDGVLLSTFRTAQLLKRTHAHRLEAMASPQRSASPAFVNGLQKQVDFDPRVAWRLVPSAGGGAWMVFQRQLVNLADQLRCSFNTTYGGGLGVSIVQTGVAALSNTGTLSTPFSLTAPLPVDIAASADGRDLAIAAAGSEMVFTLGSNGELVQTALSERATPTAVGYRSNNLLVVFSREPAMLLFAYPRDSTSSVPTKISLSAVSVKSTGHEIFHRATTSGISCAGCHPEAGEDGHTWILPEGKRRTPSLRGGLIGTTPFHWAGDLKDMSSLMSEVLTRRMGGNIQSEERSTAALKWLDAQPAIPAPRTLSPEAIERGRVLFTSAAIGCASCHTGALGTNNANAQVGTGHSLQVPRLVELSYRAPFFHDGRVPTLAERFTALGGGDAHGHVSTLTAAETADLVTYLKSR
jgi:mono/diheme cytochrome c family protein